MKSKGKRLEKYEWIVILDNKGEKSVTSDELDAGQSIPVMVDVRSGTSNLWALPLLGRGQEKQITHFTTGTIWDFAYSPDGKWIAMARGPMRSDAVMFREAK